MKVGADVDEVHGEDEKGSPDEYWPERDEEVGERGVDDRRVTSDVFENVEPVALNEDGQKSTRCGLGRCARSVELYKGATHTESYQR